MVLVGSVIAPSGACMFLTVWRSLIIQHVTTTIKMKQAALMVQYPHGSVTAAKLKQASKVDPSKEIKRFLNEN